MRLALSLGLVAALCMPIGPVRAHEFWIQPERFEVGPGEAIAADLEVGRMFRGESYPYLSDRFTRFTVTARGEAVTVAGFEGDVPAMAGIPARPGLNIVAHQTVPFRVTYDTWTVFRGYLKDEGLDRFADLHQSRGLPEIGFAERYTRYAKALVQSGPVLPDDRDEPLGLAFELVAAANPYAAGLERMEVNLLWQGEPVAGHQVTVFEDDGKVVSRVALHTDRAGAVAIALDPGVTYLINSVYLVPVEQEPVVWQSYWASLTFRPAANGGLRGVN